MTKNKKCADNKKFALIINISIWKNMKEYGKTTSTFLIDKK